MTKSVYTTFVLLLCSAALFAALPPVAEGELSAHASVVIEGTVKEIKTKRTRSGWFSKKTVKEHYTITLNQIKVLKSLAKITEQEVKITGYTVVRMPHPGPTGHTGISTLKIGDKIKAYLHTTDAGFTLVEPNGLQKKD